MSKSINRATLLGHVGQHLALTPNPTGKAVVEFSVATNTHWLDKAGKEQKETEWHSVVAWGKLAEICVAYIKKGHPVYVEGRLKTKRWEDASGVAHFKTQVIASEVVVLGPKETEEKAQ